MNTKHFAARLMRPLTALVCALLLPAAPQASSDDALVSAINKLSGVPVSMNRWPSGRPREWVDHYYLGLPAIQGEYSVYGDRRAQQFADEIFRLTNEARMKKGHTPLKRDRHLDAVSQAHAHHMAARNFFEHEDPLGLEAWDRMEAVDCPGYWASGENIAAGYRNAEEAHKSWMDSSGHRKNIRNEDYRYIGIGVFYDPDSEYGWYWVQTFATYEDSPDEHDWIEPGELCP